MISVRKTARKDCPVSRSDGRIRIADSRKNRCFPAYGDMPPRERGTGIVPRDRTNSFSGLPVREGAFLPAGLLYAMPRGAACRERGVAAAIFPIERRPGNMNPAGPYPCPKFNRERRKVHLILHAVSTFCFLGLQ